MLAWRQAFEELTPFPGLDATSNTAWVWPTRMARIHALVTPPWSVDVGADVDPAALTERMEACSVPIQILDLPAGAVLPTDFEFTSKSKSVCVHQRHTRQIQLQEYKLPKKRAQQARRAAREGTTVVESLDLAQHVALHQAARHRKGISSDENGLRALMAALLSQPANHAYVALHGGRAVASAIVVRSRSMAAGPVALYALGGQDRMPSQASHAVDPNVSARASVAVLAHAIEAAREAGDQIFDFGGSSDPGVDRFYAEFGAAVVPKIRLVKTARWIRPFVALKRPDLLFPKPVPSS